MAVVIDTNRAKNKLKSGRNYKARFKTWSSGLTLIGLGGWLLLRLLDGTLSYYLHPRFNLLIGVTGLAIILLGGWLMIGGKVGFDEPDFKGLELLTGITLIGLVALFGLLVMPRPLDSSRLNLTSTKGGVAVSGGNTNRALAQALLKQDWKDSNTLDTVRWSLLDWSAALNDPQRAEKLQNRPADVVGFVVRPPGGSKGYFLVARYVVVCCTADSSALRVPVISDKVQELEEGQWVRVRGVLGQGSNGVTAFLGNNVEVVPRPAQPYIFP